MWGIVEEVRIASWYKVGRASANGNASPPDPPSSYDPCDESLWAVWERIGVFLNSVVYRASCDAYFEVFFD